MRTSAPQALLPLASLLLLGALPTRVDAADGGSAALQCRVTFVDSPDSDGDGLLDATEAWMGTDPRRADTDGDQLPDGWEVSHQMSPVVATGTDGPDGDPDGDGAYNYNEYVADTNPRDADSVLRIRGIERYDGMTQLLWQGGTHAWQYLEATVTVDVPDSWELIRVVPPDTPPLLMAYDLSPTNTVRFYRIRATRDAP